MTGSTSERSHGLPGPDPALWRRIVVILAVVVAMDLAFVLAVAALLDPWLAPVTAALAGVVGAGPARLLQWVLMVAPILAVFLWAQIGYTRRQTLAAVDARVVGEDEYPDLYARTTRLAAAADVAVPRVAVVETSVPNSFTVGSPRDAVVVVSEGLLSALSEDELDAVLAHELAHVVNRDATVMTLAGFLPALAGDGRSVLGDRVGDLAGSLAFWALVVGGAYLLALPSLSSTGPGSLVVVAGAVLAAAVFGSVLLGLLAAPVVVLARRLSRYREFAADRAGALVAGSPAALASALRTLDDEAESPPATDSRSSIETARIRGLCLLPHGFGSAGTAGDDGVRVETRSHPPTQERIRRLRELAAEFRA